MSEKRKKKDVIKQKNKLKVTEKFKLLTYARWITLATAILVLLIFFLNTGFSSASMNEMFTKNPVIVVGFMICVIDLLVWYQMEHLITYLTNLEHIETVRIQLIAIAIIQLLGFNYLSFFCLILALVRYFRWDQFSIKEAFLEIKKEGQLTNTLTLSIGLILFALLALGLLYLFQSVSI